MGLCVRFGGSWDSNLYLLEFPYNNGFQATIGMTPYEALYGKKCRSSSYWDEVCERFLLGQELVHMTNYAIQKIITRMQTAENMKKHYGPTRRRGLEFDVEEHVFVRVSPMKNVLRFGKEGKLSPSFI